MRSHSEDGSPAKGKEQASPKGADVWGLLEEGAGGASRLWLPAPAGANIWAQLFAGALPVAAPRLVLQPWNRTAPSSLATVSLYKRPCVSALLSRARAGFFLLSPPSPFAAAVLSLGSNAAFKSVLRERDDRFFLFYYG